MTFVRRGVRTLSLVCCFLLALATCKTLRYRTYEEDEPGSVIGTLAEELPGGGGTFRLMKLTNHSSLIRVRESDGQLSLGGRLDREQLCGPSPSCHLALDVVSLAKEQFRLVHVEVEVKDINDNSPHFPSPEIPVEVSESSPVGTRIPLEVAVDEDVGSNSIQSFQISVNSHFSLDVQTRADGVKYADLLLVKELDRETQATYVLELVATDGGSPGRSGSAMVNVRVLDANDNSPVFSRSAVTVELPEDAPVGYLLLELHAEDPDEGANGDIVYGWSPQVPPELRQLFKIDPRSGRLTLEGPVDFEAKQTYELDVQAQDRGANPRGATCKLIVRVLDVNDNAPAVSITPLTGAGAALITEAAAEDSFVALISTADRDSGANGQVQCALYGHEHFRLKQAYEDSFMIVTTGPLDRERIAEYNVTVVAEDRGSPPHKTVRPYTIRLLDENDNAPVFAKPLYEVAVPENNAPGAYITTVLARDPDLGPNGKVTYRLAEAEISGAPASTYVSLDPTTGAVYALRSFNHELLPVLELRVRATDGGSPPLQSQTLLRLRIVDQNDNAPVIVSPVLANGSAEVVLPARAPHGYLVTQVRAKDPDEGANGELAFSLEGPGGLFAINKASGELFLTADLSGELGQVFRTLVTVTDHGRPPLATTATVSFIVTAATPPANPELMQPSSADGAKNSRWDVPLIVIIVLAGSCTLLLAAIITIATTCNRRRARAKSERDISELAKGEQDDEELIASQKGASNLFDARAFPNATTPFTGTEPPAVTPEVPSTEETFSGGLYDTQKRLRTANSENYTPAPGYGKEGATVTVWKGHSFNTISIREAEKFSGKDSGKGDSDFNDSDSDISGDALKKDLINHMQTGLWACTTECKILGHSDRCWSPSCGRPPNVHSATLHTGQHSVSSFGKSTSLPRDPLHRDNYYQSSQAHLQKTGGLQCVYEKVPPKDYDSRTITLISPPRSGRLPDLQEISMPLYKSPGTSRYVPPQDTTCEQDEL